MLHYDLKCDILLISICLQRIINTPIGKERNKLAKIFDFKNEYSGLSAERVAENLKLYGYNSKTKLDEKDRGYNPLKAFFNLRFVLMMTAAALSVIYGIFGTAEPDIEKIVTGGVLVLLAGAYAASEIIKNTRCDEYFFELKHRSRSECHTMRDGELRLVKREHLVPDDIIVLEAGEYVPADAHLLEIEKLTVDESVFTNSRKPVKKITGADSLNEELKKSCIYKGTKIVHGRLVARVTATGVDTKHYKEFGAPRETDEYYTTMEKLVIRVSNVFTGISAAMLLFSVLFRFTGIDINAQNPILETLFGALSPAVAFALCFIPASASSIIRMYYIKCAKELEEKNTRIKNLETIEHINAATCILIDKSGTVTRNRMTVADTFTANASMMTNICVLASSREPSELMDQAIILDATFKGVDAAELHQNELIKEYPFSEAEGASGSLWNVNGSKLLCIKGSPDKLLPLCDVPNEMIYSVQNKQVTYGQQGYNVLAVAFANLDDDAKTPKKISEIRYSFMGLIAFDNPTRDYIPAAVRNCSRAGIRVIMTTGDSPEAALAIAQKIGIKGSVMTGEELLANEEADISGIGVFARITADMKPVIIKRLQKSGEIVAISGESATDSNLLEISDIGISLAGNVSGAAFEACDVVVGDDNFETVVETLRTTRQTHYNIKRAVCAALTSYTAIAVFALVNMLLGSDFILLPVICTLLSAAVTPAVMLMFFNNRADTRGIMEASVLTGKGIFRKTSLIRPLAQAIGIAAAEVMFYLISSGFGNQSAETVAKMSDSCRSNFLLIFVFGMLISGWINLSDRNIFSAFISGQGFAWLVTGITIASSIAAVFIPFVNTALGFGTVDIMMLIIAFAVTLVFQLPVELFKLTRRKEM